MTKNRLVNITAELGGRAITIISVFDAARELVFKAYTDPTLIPQWWGLKAHATTVDALDVRFGGVWRLVSRDADGNEFAFKGVYHSVVPPERLVRTSEFEGMPDHVSLETATFEEQDGKTKVTAIAVFQTVEDRDGMRASGMEAGVTETMERLAELLQKLNGQKRSGS
ncbi:MAG: SRPBCC family protein [Halobacteriota archaeon]